MDPNQQTPPQPAPIEPQQTAAAPPPSQPTASPAGENPGKTLGIISLITALLGFGLVGLILGIIGLNKSKKAGMKNGLALAGIIIGIISTVLGLLFFFLVVLGTTSIVQKCQELGPGTHQVDGVTYTCS